MCGDTPFGVGKGLAGYCAVGITFLWANSRSACSRSISLHCTIVAKLYSPQCVIITPQSYSTCPPCTPPPANDGLVSVASLLMGVGAGSTSLTTLRLSGIAGLVGGALSMGVGEYISVSSQRDAELADIEVERREQLKGPDARRREQRELAEIYVARGLPPALADEVATVLSDRHVDDVVRTHARDELGIDVDELAQPFQAALISVLCFTAGGGLPLLSACFIADPRIRLYSIAIATTIGLCVGIKKRRLGGFVC